MPLILGISSLAAGPAKNAVPAKDRSYPKYLVSAEAKQTISAAELKNSYGAIAAFVKNGYTAYRITYHTAAADGKDIIASGAVFVPDVKEPLPLLNYNHGTIFPSQEKSAPSYLGMNAEAGIAKLFAANGYLAVMPDYIGYGSSKNSDHPYGAYNVIAVSVNDMLPAVKEFCTEKKIPLSGKNFFSGWSEGAAVSLATVKRLEETNSEFVPTAAVLNAGPYYSSAFIDHILDANAPLQYMSSYIWVLQSYNKLYKINKPSDYYFTQPAAAMLEKNPEVYISKNPQELFTAAFREDYKTGKDSALRKALQENDLWQWKPRCPITFCHGDRDEYVPLFNSEKAYAAMKAAGADVTLLVFKGQNHTSGVFGFLQTAFMAFEKLK